MIAGATTAAVAIGLVACAPKNDAMLGKTAIRGRLSDEGVTDAGAPAPPLLLAEQWRVSATRVGDARFVSKGHAAGRWEATLWANGAAMGALDAGRGDFPVGARFVEQHFERRGADAGGPVMLMEKRPPGFDPDGGDWRYAVVNTAGALVSDGKIEPCAECHGDAPRDHVFAIEAR